MEFFGIDKRDIGFICAVLLVAVIWGLVRGGKMKNCIDCKWCQVPVSNLIQLVDTEYFCNHPKTLGDVNIVTGRASKQSCYALRRKGADCGEEGKLWEAK